MDFNTHKKFARLDDGTEDPSTKSVVVPAPEVREIDEADKLAKIISDTLLSKDQSQSGETPEEMKERVLLALPEPLEELKSYHSLSEEEKKKIIDRVWEQRQRDLAEAMKEIRGDIHSSL